MPDILPRLPDWEARLSALIARVSDDPFAFGKHDCGQFARQAIEAMTGIDLSSDGPDYSDSISAGLAMHHAGAGDMGVLAQTIAGLHGIEEIAPSFATRGDIVLAPGPDGPGLAVVVGSYAVAPARGTIGLGRVPRENWSRAWSTKSIAATSNVGELFPKVADPATISFLIGTLITLIISFATSAIGAVLSKPYLREPRMKRLRP